MKLEGIGGPYAIRRDRLRSLHLKYVSSFPKVSWISKENVSGTEDVGASNPGAEEENIKKVTDRHKKDFVKSEQKVGKITDTAIDFPCKLFKCDAFLWSVHRKIRVWITFDDELSVDDQDELTNDVY